MLERTYDKICNVCDSEFQTPNQNQKCCSLHCVQVFIIGIETIEGRKMFQKLGVERKRIKKPDKRKSPRKRLISIDKYPEIYKRYFEDGDTIRSISNRFNVKYSYISVIIQKKRTQDRIDRVKRWMK